MQKASALETLIELAQTRTDDAARRLGALNAKDMDMQAKLALLTQYSDEYRARFQTLAQQGLTASDWRNYPHSSTSWTRQLRSNGKPWPRCASASPQASTTGDRPNAYLTHMTRWRSARRARNQFVRRDMNSVKRMSTPATRRPAGTEARRNDKFLMRGL